VRKIFKIRHTEIQKSKQITQPLNPEKLQLDDNTTASKYSNQIKN